MTSLMKAISNRSEMFDDSEVIVVNSAPCENTTDRSEDATSVSKSDFATSPKEPEVRRLSSNSKTSFQLKGFCQRIWKAVSQRFSSSSSFETAEESAKSTEVDSEASLPSDSTPSISTTASSSPDPLEDVRNSLPRKGWKIEQESSSESMPETSTTSTGTDESESELNGLTNGSAND